MFWSGLKALGAPLRRLESWREAKGPVACHASELADEFGVVVNWKGPFSPKALAVYSVFGVEPSRAEANLKVGELVGVVRVPKPFSKMNAVRNAMFLEHNPALVVRKGERIFVEPAFRHQKGFASIPEPLKVAREMSEEIGHPVIIIKEVPTYCCWLPAPLAWTGVPVTEAGEFRRGVPIGVSLPKAPIKEGCWELEGELEEEEGEGFPLESLRLIKISLADKLKKLLIPLRVQMVKAFGKP